MSKSPNLLFNVGDEVQLTPKAKGRLTLPCGTFGIVAGHQSYIDGFVEYRVRFAFETGPVWDWVHADEMEHAQTNHKRT